MYRSKLIVALVASVVALAACSGSVAPTPGPTTIPAPSGTTGGAPLTQGQLRLLLIDTLGPRWYCDPDVYPVAHGDEQSRALARFAEMQAEGDIYQHVAVELGIDLSGPPTDAQKLAIYEIWKVALSIPMDPVGNGTYRFDYLAQPASGATSGTHTTGTIDAAGTIAIDQQSPSGEPMCPICLARGTLIETPLGPIAVDALRLGDPVWTLDSHGKRIAGTVIALGSTTAPAYHHVIRLTLADGRSVTASPGHPLADGRTFGELEVGDLVGGSTIATLESLPYSGGETFDLVASGPTGIYISDGIALGSTLAPAR